MFEWDKLDGLHFLDGGSGNGLFSFTGRHLGDLVHSFDYEPGSVGCAQTLYGRCLTGDKGWIIEDGEILDMDYLDKLSTFDVTRPEATLAFYRQHRYTLVRITTEDSCLGCNEFVFRVPSEGY